jgi:hypothetical protein
MEGQVPEIMTDFPARRRCVSALLRWAPMLIVATAFVHGLAASWLRWGDLVTDTGRELQLPQRMLAGEALYSDLRYYYGPLSPYINMLLYRLFGVRLEVLAWAGIVSAALMCVGLYRLSRSFLGPWPSATVAAVFLYTCAFSGSIFNFVLPYSYAATYGILAATWSIHWLVRYVQQRTRAALFLSAACLALTGLTKMEIFFAACAAHATFLALSGSERRLASKRHLIAYGVTAALIVGTYGLLAARTGSALWHGNLGSLFGAQNQAMRHFLVAVAGLDHIGHSVPRLAVSAMEFGVVMFVTSRLARIAARKIQWCPAYAPVFVAGLCSFCAYWLLSPVLLGVHTLVGFVAFPLIALAAITVLAAHWLRQPERRTEWSAHLILWVFAAACLPRILLVSSPRGYGFFLFPPGLVAFGVLLFSYAPRLMGSSGWPRRVVQAAGVGFFAAGALAAFQISTHGYALHTEEIRTPRGRLYVLADGIQAPAVRVLSGLPSGTRVLALPEGAGLVFMSGLLPPRDGMFSYLPVELYGNYGEPQVLARWMANPPQVVLMIDRPMLEYGYRGFGVDYAKELAGWVLENYEPTANTNAGFMVMRRR